MLLPKILYMLRHFCILEFCKIVRLYFKMLYEKKKLKIKNDCIQCHNSFATACGTCTLRIDKKKLLFNHDIYCISEISFISYSNYYIFNIWSISVLPNFQQCFICKVQKQHCIHRTCAYIHNERVKR